MLRTYDVTKSENFMGIRGPAGTRAPSAADSVMAHTGGSGRTQQCCSQLDTCRDRRQMPRLLAISSKGQGERLKQLLEPETPVDTVSPEELVDDAHRCGATQARATRGEFFAVVWFSDREPARNGRSTVDPYGHRGRGASFTEEQIRLNLLLAAPALILTLAWTAGSELVVESACEFTEMLTAVGAKDYRYGMNSGSAGALCPVHVAGWLCALRVRLARHVRITPCRTIARRL
jgi:hypothetical protein